MKNLGVLSEYAATRVKNVFHASATLDVTLHPALKTHKEYFEKHVGDLRAATDRAVMKYRKDIINRQLVVERLANMAIDLFATICVIARTQAFIDAKGVEACERELALCNLFCVDAGRRIRAAREALTGREDEVDDTRRDVAGAVRQTQMYFVEDAILQDR
jgi:acyl-CoA dehydrogenase family protein 9